MLLLAFSHPTKAMTRAIFMPNDSQVHILLQANLTGPADDDPKRLFEIMAVDLQEVPGQGQGKVIETADKKMTTDCVVRANSSYLCHVILKKSALSKISFRDQTATYEADGDLAQELITKFFTGDGGHLHFKSSDGFLTLESDGTVFRIQYKR
jgi:hypothetical protein